METQLGRLTFKDLPGSDPDVTYTYDLLGRMTGASQTGTSLGFGYDALGRRTTETNPFGTYTSAYDLAGRRTRLTHPDGFYVDQDYLVTGEMVHIRENGASSGVGVLATYAYDDLGRRTSVTYGDGSTTSYSYDGASRLTQQVLDLAGTASDLTLGFTYNPAGQIVTNTRSNDTYAWTGHYNVNRGYTANGLNQYSAVASLTPTYDAKGNLTSDATNSMTYDSENRLTQFNATHLFADPLGQTGTVQVGTNPPGLYYDHDGASIVAERGSSGALLYRHVFGPWPDEPLVWYTSSGTGTRWFYHQDERGSTVAMTDGSGAIVSTTAYDEYGTQHSSGTIPRFAYTGQLYYAGVGLYNYKARMYSPTWGRFLQTDPIGYGDGMHLYNYVGSDPVNSVDPSGLTSANDPITVTHPHLQDGPMQAPFALAPREAARNDGRAEGGAPDGPECDGSETNTTGCAVAVTATRPVPRPTPRPLLLLGSPSSAVSAPNDRPVLPYCNIIVGSAQVFCGAPWPKPEPPKEERCRRAREFATRVRFLAAGSALALGVGTAAQAPPAARGLSGIALAQLVIDAELAVASACGTGG